MTEEYVRLDLLRPNGGLLARVEAKLAGQILGWPVDAPPPAASPLLGWITYSNANHSLQCRFAERGTQALPQPTVVAAFHP
jgi:hypothetical protein